MNHDEDLPASSEQKAESPAMGPGGELPLAVERFEYPQWTGKVASTETATLDALGDVELDVRIDLGRTYMRLDDALGLEDGAIVPLDKTVEEPVDIVAGGRLIARGEILVLDENYCVRVTELVA